MNLYSVLRSAGERTVPLAERLVAEGVNGSVAVIRETPLAKSLQTTLERAMDACAEWVLVCDADVLAFPDGLKEALDQAQAMPADYFQFTGRVFDHLFGRQRTLGIRIYRLSLAPLALDLLRTAADPRRPESSIITEMEMRGHRSAIARRPLGVHDAAQWQRDYYRKGFFFAHKHEDKLSALVPHWRAQSTHDQAFRAALLGLADGLVSTDPGADTTAFDDAKVRVRLESCGVRERVPLEVEEAKELRRMSEQAWAQSPARGWETSPFPRNPKGQWAEFRRDRSIGDAVGQMRSYYSRRGFRSLVTRG